MMRYQIGLTVLAARIAFALPNAEITAAPLLARQASYSESAPHTADHAPVVNPMFAETAEVSEVCIHFTSENSNWGWTKQAPWGSGSGTFGELTDGKMCVPTDNSAGGALFIGPNSSPGAGSTKMECFFPTSGTANCDMSLVDGYSLSVTCTAGSMKIGGDVDLWTDGKSCPDTADKSEGICLNENGYDSSQSDVAAFFQPAVKNGNQYCIWVDCSQDYYFDVTDTISCKVTGTDAS